MEDRYALVGVSAGGQKKALVINLTADETRRIKRALDRMKQYVEIEVTPMRLLSESPEES